MDVGNKDQETKLRMKYKRIQIKHHHFPTTLHSSSFPCKAVAWISNFAFVLLVEDCYFLKNINDYSFRLCYYKRNFKSWS